MAAPPESGVGAMDLEPLEKLLGELRRRQRDVSFEEIESAVELAADFVQASDLGLIRDLLVGRWHLAHSQHVEAYQALAPRASGTAAVGVAVGSTNTGRHESLSLSVLEGFTEACVLLTNYAEAYRAARNYVERAMTSTAADAQWHLGHALTWLGGAQVQLGYYQAALGSLSRAVDVFDDLALVAQGARAHNGLGIAFEENGDFDTAYSHYAKAYQHAIDDGHLDMQGRVLANWGDALIAEARFDEGLAKLHAAIEVLESVGAYWHSGWCELAVGKAYVAQGRMDDALAMHKSALASVRRSAAPRVEAEVLAGLGELHGKMGNYELARMQLEYALAIATRTGAEREIFKTHEMLARVHKQFGNFERALHHHEQFHAVRTKVYDELARMRLSQIVDEQAIDRLSRERDLSFARAVELEDALREVKALNTKLLEKAQQLEYISNQDVLTGLHNRRYLYARINEEIGRAERHGLALSMVLYDVDHFKSVNDRFSHEIGDDVLRTLATIISTGLRQFDVHVRYGGEEFAVMMPQTDADAAIAVAEKIRETVAKFDWAQIAPALKVTISVGVVTMHSGETMAAVLRRVDAKLYEAKRGGRDRVVQG